MVKVWSLLTAGVVCASWQPVCYAVSVHVLCVVAVRTHDYFHFAAAGLGKLALRLS